MESQKLEKKYQHGFLAAFWMEQAGLSKDLVHSVIAHTPLSAVVPQTQEAVIVHYADFADSDSLLLDGPDIIMQTKVESYAHFTVVNRAS